MKTYQHIFFDLDHTLWDLEKNSLETLTELFETHQLSRFGVTPFSDFVKIYSEINSRMWKYYLRGDISRDTLRFGRFHKAFLEFGLDNVHLAKSFGEAYSKNAPYKTHVHDGAHEVLAYLQKKYSLHILTNGFEEIQHIKIKQSKLDPYFTHVVTSDKANAKKPSREIFEYILKLSGATKENSLMVGDNYEADIIGARNAGIDQVYFNTQGDKPGKICTKEIFSLRELFDFI